MRLDAIYCSPLDRTRETAAPLTAHRAVPVQISDALLEIDYGDWTGRRIEELGGDEQWTQWNRYRSGTRVPNGESMTEIQIRIVAEMQRLSDLHPGQNVALVSHGDVIKAAVAHFLGVPLDLFQRIEISPASVSIVLRRKSIRSRYMSASPAWASRARMQAARSARARSICSRMRRWLRSMFGSETGKRERE